MSETDSKDKTPRVDSTLSKGLAILENLASASSGKGVTELSRELGLTKSNTFRLLQSLKSLGYVRTNEDKTYTATLKVWQVGTSVINQLNVRDICAEEMKALARDSEETIYLAVREGYSVVYVDKIESQKPIRSWNPVGGSAPIHCVGTGKALLAASYDVLRDGLKDKLTRFTDRTLTTIAALDKDMEATQQRGYAFDQGEFRNQIFSFGAAITLPDRTPVAALGISVPEINLPENGQADMGRLVLQAANRVSLKMAQL